jgi:hypothetical protein
MTGDLILIAAGVTFFWLLTRLFVRVLRRSERSRAPAEKLESLLEERDSAAWRALAADAASQGRYGASVSALFMAALRLSDERRVVAYDAARTPNEYRRRIAEALASASPAFDQLTSCFVRAVYGALLPERALYDTAACAYVAFAKEVGAL